MDGGGGVTCEAMVEAFLQIRPELTRQVMGCLHHREDTEDVLQNVFLRAWLSCGSLREDNRFPGWIRRITTHEIVNLLRRRNVVYPLYEVYGLPDGAAEDRIEDYLDFIHAVRTMKKPLRIAFCLYYLHGDSVRWIAQRTGCPAGTVGRRLYEARGWVSRQMGAAVKEK